MKLNQVGFVGWRGMVGSVLLQRMREEGDFGANSATIPATATAGAADESIPANVVHDAPAAPYHIDSIGGGVAVELPFADNDTGSGVGGGFIDQPVFFTTSQVGQSGPDIGRDIPKLRDAHDLNELAKMDAIVTCQGGDYTAAVHANLRAHGWRGFWIDAASTLRLADNSTIALDPVNRDLINRNLQAGQRDFIGGNCTVSLMVMALHGLFAEDLMDWISVNTYQAISGGGAKQMRELLIQMGALHRATEDILRDPASSILEIDRIAGDAQREIPSAEIGFPLAGSLLPWIDRDLDNGISREELKGAQETLKILGRDTSGGGGENDLDIHSTCVRIGVLRCHSQAFTIKLKRDLPLNEIGERIDGANEWVKLIGNRREQSLAELTPAAVSGTLSIPVGRLRKFSRGRDAFLSAFTVGDQLLWGAAEPIRRMLRILAEH